MSSVSASVQARSRQQSQTANASASVSASAAPRQPSKLGASTALLQRASSSTSLAQSQQTSRAASATAPSRQSQQQSQQAASRASQQATASVSASVQARSASASRAAQSAAAASRAAQSAAARRQSNVTRIARDLMQLNASFSASAPAQSASFAAASQAASQAASAALSLGLSATAASRVATAAAASRLATAAGNCGGCGRLSAQQQQAYLSELEQLILQSQQPVELNENEEIEVNGERGLWANRAEVQQWRGDIPLEEYLINQDANPEVITKRAPQNLEYVQELAVRYLRPPTPPAPGEILITQENNICTGPAPPLIIRQQPPRPETPAPLVIREAPPAPPAQVGQKVITISGKRIPPPPRKVIIERLAALPTKPQSVLIERWLPYAQVKRRVIFQGPTCECPVVVPPRNVIVQWEAPQVNVRKEVREVFLYYDLNLESKRAKYLILKRSTTWAL
jgi:hypothetical protein